MTDAPGWVGLRPLLDAAVVDRVFPGAALLIGRGDEIVHECYSGSLEEGGTAVSADTVYDLSSLTKPLGTTATLLRRAAGGGLALDDPFATVFPEFVDAAPPDERALRESVTIADLLSHQAGLEAVGAFWRRLQKERPRLMGKRAALETMAGFAAEQRLASPPRTKPTYSDLGFLMLGFALQRSSGTALADLVSSEFLAPLTDAVGFRPVENRGRDDDLDAVAPCGSCSWRGGIVRGTVQDENAWAVGGVGGHAGLFGTARGVHALVAEYVNSSNGCGRLLDCELVRRCWQPQPGAPTGSTWVGGWDTPTVGASSGGRYISPGSIGHLGFTGTSVWVDRVRGVHVILLTNRLHPDSDNIAIRQFRPRIHDAVFSAIDGGASAATVSR